MLATSIDAGSSPNGRYAKVYKEITQKQRKLDGINRYNAFSTMKSTQASNPLDDEVNHDVEAIINGKVDIGLGDNFKTFDAVRKSCKIESGKNNGRNKIMSPRDMVHFRNTANDFSQLKNIDGGRKKARNEIDIESYLNGGVKNEVDV